MPGTNRYSSDVNGVDPLFSRVTVDWSSFPSAMGFSRFLALFRPGFCRSPLFSRNGRLVFFSLRDGIVPIFGTFLSGLLSLVEDGLDFWTISGLRPESTGPDPIPKGPRTARSQ